ncbi:PIG-L deacetylase family protein [Chitinophaga flava]|uniref:PIG-L family deacetylase n=1 Tax=Chitinophaga flava TaxID=2259036 RepID=A0A365Y1I4_9BACT|nr:PIG-L family deacetylase [Chitinophaga flava]RBL92469.1 hypothetical protein DF182_07770 [Chitinophaga flava]
MSTLILEPHFDDTAYSMAGLLLSGVISADTTIVTIFSRSAFAPYSALSDTEKISALRYTEHKHFCKKIAVRAHVLEYDEALLRGWSISNIFDHTCDIDHEKQLKQRISSDLAMLNETLRPAEVYSPLGICGHIDHILVRQCAEQVFPLKIKYYEELPYAGEIRQEEYTHWISKLTKDLYPQINTDISVLEQRLSLLRFYRSQVTEKDITSVRKYMNMHQGERFWSKTNMGI